MELSNADRVELTGWTRKSSGEIRRGRRASIVLALGEGKSVSQVAVELGLDRNTVRLWRDRFVSGGTDALASTLRDRADQKLFCRRKRRRY